jgi:cation diffusion facilitator CzcD-associated flavoprotein CzcO
MVNARQIVFSLLGWLLQFPDLSSNAVHEQKSIAIVGAGSAGLAMLKTLLDIPEYNSWNIVLFEERENVGGIWYVSPVLL